MGVRPLNGSASQQRRTPTPTPPHGEGFCAASANVMANQISDTYDAPCGELYHQRTPLKPVTPDLIRGPAAFSPRTIPQDQRDPGSVAGVTWTADGLVKELG